MKPLLLIPALMLAACASRAPKPALLIAHSAPSSRPVSTAALRAPERLREYRFGRYVDPGDPLTMHEGHPVYRIETSAGWDLQPGSAVTPRSRVPTEAPSVSTNDAVVAEVNKQRVATRAFTAQTATLNEQLAAMQRATARVEDLAEQNLAIKGELKALRDRVDEQGSQPRERRSATSPQPPAPAEDKW